MKRSTKSERFGFEAVMLSGFTLVAGLSHMQDSKNGIGSTCEDRMLAVAGNDDNDL